jgi:hypothetical protein
MVFSTLSQLSVGRLRGSRFQRGACYIRTVGGGGARATDWGPFQGGRIGAIGRAS